MYREGALTNELHGQGKSVVLNLVIAFPREIPHHNVFVVTVAEEGLAVLLLILINILWCVRLCYSIKDLPTLNIIAPLLRDTSLGK